MSVNFFSGYDNPDFSGGADQANIDSEINNLMSGNLGKQMAANSTGRIRQVALDNLRTFSNNPSLGRNASVSAAFGDKIQGETGRGIIDANLRGAEFDQRSQIQGAQLSEKDRDFKYNDFQRKLERSDRPSPFASFMTSLASNAIGTFTGYGVAGLAKGLFTPGKGGNNPNSAPPMNMPNNPPQNNNQSDNPFDLEGSPDRYNLMKGYNPYPNNPSPRNYKTGEYDY